MAKWGEGDPRWIVEERADATNVNNWHWTEKNATPWSKERLTALLKGLKIQNDKYDCEITGLSKIEGEASASNRKAKLIFFYEWVINAEWKGSISGSEKSHKGKLEIPNLSEENDADELDVIVTADTQKEEAYELKEFIRKHGTGVIREQLAKYIKDLKEEFSKGLILPTDKENKPVVKHTSTSKSVKENMSQPVLNHAKSVGVKIRCKRLTDKVEFKCQAVDIYRALTQPDMVMAFTRGPAEVEAEKGGYFSLLGGNVTGEFTDLVPFEKLVMRWRFKTWPEAHFSTVTLTFNEKSDCTEVQLVQTGVPENELDRTKEGWQRYYWQSIKQTFGYGAQLF